MIQIRNKNFNVGNKVISINSLTEENKLRFETLKENLKVELNIANFAFITVTDLEIGSFGGGYSSKKNLSDISLEIRNELDWLNNLTL